MRSLLPSSTASTTKRKKAVSCGEERIASLATTRSSAARICCALGRPSPVNSWFMQLPLHGAAQRNGLVLPRDHSSSFAVQRPNRSWLRFRRVYHTAAARRGSIRKLRSDCVKLTTRFSHDAASANKQYAPSRSRPGERLRRRADDLAARRCDAQHGETALV